MSDVLPPFGPAPGPPASDRQVVAAFARNEPAGHSQRLHVEGDVLHVDVLVIGALRLAPRTVLVRVDGPEEAAWVPPMLGTALAGAGLACLDENTLLGLPVALQLVGIRLSEWDLWGDDIDDAFAALRRIAAGGDP